MIDLKDAAQSLPRKLKRTSVAVVDKKKEKPKKLKKPTHIPFARFAAIDFETADYGRDSACALAIVVAEKGKIVKKVYSLIRPPRRDFVFSYLHGITWRDVAAKPAFGELWPTIQCLFDNVDFIAAHNASFDRSVLHSCCAMDGHVVPPNKYLCSMKLARCQWSIFPTKLSDVCNHFNIGLNHHDAASDALACANIVLKAAEVGAPIKAFLSELKK
jgi:DNA polymerase-3 subunit epsilon